MEILLGDRSTITGPQCRAACALVETILARRSGIDVCAIEGFENIVGSLKCANIHAIQNALEELEAASIPENGLGYGVRLKFSNVDAVQIARLECEGCIVAHDRAP